MGLSLKSIEKTRCYRCCYGWKFRILADKEIRVGIGEIHFFPAPEQTRHRLGMGSNMYPSASASLFSNHKDESLADVPVEQLIENADAFAAVFPEQKYEIVKKLQELKHICSMTGDGCSPALKRANSGIDVAAATDYHQRIVTTQAIFQRIMSYTVSALF
uniref:Uncharacterized protein n=1 Tax=Brassica oleracea var. oleracea TaxID=109376 RepID=A0A0D3BLQ6_BRAOL